MPKFTKKNSLLTRFFSNFEKIHFFLSILAPFCVNARTRVCLKKPFSTRLLVHAWVPTSNSRSPSPRRRISLWEWCQCYRIARKESLKHQLTRMWLLLGQLQVFHQGPRPSGAGYLWVIFLFLLKWNLLTVFSLMEIVVDSFWSFFV